MPLVYSFPECSTPREVGLSMKRKKILTIPETLIIDDLPGPHPTPEAIKKMDEWYALQRSRREN